MRENVGQASVEVLGTGHPDSGQEVVEPGEAPNTFNLSNYGND